MLSKFFNIDLSKWEEELLCRLYLKEVALDQCSFSKEILFKFTKLKTKLDSLPRTWAKELALNPLVEEDQNE